MKFSGYSLNKTLLSALTALNYLEPTPIQEKTLVKALKGQSLIAKSETGSGKTHAYLIPVINNIQLDLNKVQAIIIEPTLELCQQCNSFGNEIACRCSYFKTALYSNEFTSKLNLPTILILTPGQLKEYLFIKKCLDVSQVKTLVLDEADMLLEGEESQDVIALVDKINAPQKLIFTATMKEHQIASLKKLFSINEMIDVNKKNYSSNNVKHHFVDIKHRSLFEAVNLFLKTVQPYFCLIFASTKKVINNVYKSLCDEGIECAFISSDISPRERKSILKRINDGEFSIVLCSDVASRGLDLEKVSHVISLDIPANIDYYYHRAGRTGRYKDKGDSYIFYDDELNLKAKKQLESKLSFDYLILRDEGLKIDKKHSPQPKKKNDKLEAEIKKELAKVRSNKVKPGYKKKMKQAIEKAKKNHKRKIIMENLKSKKKMMASKD